MAGGDRPATHPSRQLRSTPKRGETSGHVTMRYVIFGAGAIGATIGARLHLQGAPVTLIARGAHLSVLQKRGLTFHEPSGTSVLQLPSVGDPGEVDWDDDTVVIIATKSQDTATAVAALAACAPPDTPVVCAQNGIANEPAVLRCMPTVYGAHVVVSADHLEPGVVARFGVPEVGLMDVGRFPPRGQPTGGTPDDATGRAIVNDLEAAGFRSTLVDDIMPAKTRKLVFNLGNAVNALVGDVPIAPSLVDQARAEAERVLAAAGIEAATNEDDRQRRRGLTSASADGVERVGGSTLQSLLRGVGAVETDFLNGEIVLLGRLRGIPTPVNETLQRQVTIAARRRLRPGSLDASALVEMVAQRERQTACHAP